MSRISSRSKGVDSDWKDSALYLRKNLGSVLPRALHDVCQARPADPIEYLAKCLYKVADSDLYFQDKAVFEREKRKIEVKMKTEDTKRQRAIERYKKHIDDLKGYLQRQEIKLKSPAGVRAKHAARRQRFQIASARTESRATKSIFDDYLSEPLSEHSSFRHDSASLSSLAEPTSMSEGLRRQSGAAPPKTKQRRKSSKRPSVKTSVKKTSLAGTSRLRHSPGRKGSSPSTETRSAVSVHKESLSTSRASYESELERSPTSLTSSSRTVSRLFSLAQEVISQQRERGAKPKPSKQKMRKPGSESRTSQQSKTDKDTTVPRKMKWKDSFSDEFSSYVSMDERDGASPVTSTSMLSERISREIKVRTEEAKRDESNISVGDASEIKEMDKSSGIKEKHKSSGIKEKHKSSRIKEMRESQKESEENILGGEILSSSKASSIASALDERIDQSFEDLEVSDSRLDLDRKDVTSAEIFIDEDEEDHVVRKERKKIRKLKLKRQLSKAFSKLDTSVDVKSSELAVEIEQKGVESIPKKKKKKRIETHAGQSADEEETEYVEETEETRRLTMESLRISTVGLTVADETNEELVEEEQQVVAVVKKRTKKKRPAVTIDVVEDEDVVIELDGEIISKQKKSDEGIAAESSETKRRTRRRAKIRGSKSSEGEDDEQERSSFPSRLPSSEPSSDDLIIKGQVSSKLSVKKAKSKIYGRRKSSSREKKSSMDVDNRVSSDDHLGLANEYSETPEQSTDLLDSTLLPIDIEQQGEEPTSSPQQTEETPEAFPFTPVECEWCLIGPGRLVCRHPVLGEIRSRPAPAAQSFHGWPSDRLTYNWRAFYDSEIYTVVEPFATETKTKRRRE